MMTKNVKYKNFCDVLTTKAALRENVQPTMQILGKMLKIKELSVFLKNLEKEQKIKRLQSIS